MNTSSKISTMLRRVQTSRSCAQPLRVGRAIEARAPRCCRRACESLRRVRVRMQRLQRVHEHAGDVAPRLAARAARARSCRPACRRRRRGGGCRGPAARRPTSRDRRRRTARCACGACGNCASRTACMTASVPDMWNETSSWPESSLQALDIVAHDGMKRPEHGAEVLDALAPAAMHSL